jgi:hypothetical protein
MNLNKINKTIEAQYNKQLEKTLTNVAAYYKINKKELFDKFLHKHTQVKTYKNKKKILDPEYKCMGRKQDGSQCSRSRKFGVFCGKHNPPKFGRIDEPINHSLFKKKQTHIIVKNEKIGDKEFIIEENTSILFDSNTKQPTVIGKKLADNKIHFINTTNSDQLNTMSTETEETTILNILSKLGNLHVKKTPEEDYESFNINSSVKSIDRNYTTSPIIDTTNHEKYEPTMGDK